VQTEGGLFQQVTNGLDHSNWSQVARTKSCYYRLWFSTEELKKWLRLIMPHIPVPSMLYKVILIYKHSLLQQRWISEVKLALPRFRAQIEEIEAHMLKRCSENDIVQKEKEN